MQIPELKSRLSILEVAHQLGIKINASGKALCPFHDDKGPSLQFSQEKGIATCFSSRCAAGTMDIVSLVEKKLQLTTHQALLQLTEWAGALPTQPTPVPVSVAAITPLPENTPLLDRITLLTQAFSYFENGLRTAKAAKAYLQGRGLRQSSPTQEGIEVGFHSGNLHNRQPELLPSLLHYGLLQPHTGNAGGYNAFARNCLVFPLKNSKGQITGLYFREIEAGKPSRHYYLKDRQGLYPHYPKAETSRLILTESVIDAASLLLIPAIASQYTVLALYGVNGFTAEHAQAVAALSKLEEVVLFMDGDEAGKKAVSNISEQLFKGNGRLKVSAVDTPQGQDVNSLLQSHEPEVFTHLLKSRHFLSSVEKPVAVTPVAPTVPVAAPAVPVAPAAAAAVTPAPAVPAPESAPSPAATPVPAAASLRETALETANPHKLRYMSETAAYYVLGGLKPDLDSLRVSLMIEQPESDFKYRAKLDLYENKHVEKIAHEAAQKLDLRADLVEMDLNRLTDLLDTYRESQLSTPTDGPAQPVVRLDESTVSQCKAFLSKAGLIGRFNELIGKAGVVGEENNRIFLAVIASSYKMPDPLHALIQGSSGSGKTHLLVKISQFIPPEDCKRFTRVTESSFYNYGSYDLSHKLICIEDFDGLKEEAQLAFRELQSRGMLSSSTSGQDEKGNIRAFEKVVYGPIASLSATTRGEVYEDNMSRCFLIAVDETREQTGRIIQYQNRKAAGGIDSEKEGQITTFIQNCIRLLKPYRVINPYADKVQLPEEAHKIRRLNDLYQSFVRQVTLLNQYRRQLDEKGRLISQKEDLQVAADIMFDSIILKIDELDGSLRLFYERLKEYVRVKGGTHYQTYSFSQRDIRQALNVSKSGLQRYLSDLLSLEYIGLAGGYANRGFHYKVLHWDNIAALRAKVKRHLEGQLDQLNLL